jgi:hypothetical protein
MENNNVIKSNSNEDKTIDMDSPEFKAYEKQLLKWLYSDSNYANRLNNEGSGNW